MLTILQLEAYRATENQEVSGPRPLRWPLISKNCSSQMVSFITLLMFRSSGGGEMDGLPQAWLIFLRDLPARDPRRPTILRSYKLMMAALLKYQAKDGMWRQLIDHDEAWEESSSTAMFTFAMNLPV